MHPNIHSSTIRNSQDGEPNPVSSNGRMDNEAVVYICRGVAVEYYSALKKNRRLLSAATRMDLEMVTVSKIIQTGKYK